MPVVKSFCGAALCCVLLALLVGGCRSDPDMCPTGTVTADPTNIPDGFNEADLFVEVQIDNPVDGLVAVTELSAVTGTIADPFALATKYACAHDVTGPVEVCVKTTYVDPEEESGALSDIAGVQGAVEYLRTSHVRLPDPLDCSHLSCTTVTCPDVKNECPIVSSFEVDPAAPTPIPEGETATISSVVEDPDGSPEPLTWTFTARHGEIADPHASETTYTCDDDFGGAIPICIEASDGACTTESLCKMVRCPGEPDGNTCPFIEDLTADPNPIARGDDTSTVAVSAVDPDAFPDPLTVRWTSEGGGFEDNTALETTFRCGEPGPVDACVRVMDGDPECLDDPRTEECIRIECPGDVPTNLCPNLNVINTPQSVIPPGSNWTPVQTRGWDTDQRPFPLSLTLYALWGSFEQTENQNCPEITIDCPHSSNVVFQDAVYICDRPGLVELCVDATDGACTKTLCTDVTCPDDITPP